MKNEKEKTKQKTILTNIGIALQVRSGKKDCRERLTKTNTQGNIAYDAVSYLALVDQRNALLTPSNSWAL